MMVDTSFEGWFQQLLALLSGHQPLWQVQPFHCRELPWADAYPDLAAWLARCDEATVDQLEADPDALTAALGPQVDPTQPWAALTAIAALPVAAEPPLPDYLGRGIGGRKWQQINAFASAVTGASGQPLLEWCGGKGHLGRVLAWRGHGPVRTLEWQQALCDEGQQLAQGFGLDQQFVCADALAPEALGQFKTVARAVALHACGDLHRVFLAGAVSHRLAAIWLSPCCYHLTADLSYRPLSRNWPATFALSRDQLQMAVQEHATSGARGQRLRLQERRYRLAFDGLQRELTGCDRYLNVPSVAKSLVVGPFADFARWAAACKGLKLTGSVDEPRWLAYADQQLARVAKLELVRHLFRRPLELLLVLDRVLYLQEHGYRVRLSTFCQRAVSPRNLLIEAWLPA